MPRTKEEAEVDTQGCLTRLIERATSCLMPIWSSSPLLLTSILSCPIPVAVMPSPITCHVLDSTLGRPGAHIDVKLELLSSSSSASPRLISTAQTNSDGRCPDLVPESAQGDVSLEPGTTYRLTFETGPYFARDGRKTFYPRVEILFALPEPDEGKAAAQHYHVPLLISPFSYTTYRGS